MADVFTPFFSDCLSENSIMELLHQYSIHSVADPGFPKNCMKLKEFGPPGDACPKFYSEDPPLTLIKYFTIQML